jgi:hypothetical protein
MEDICFVKMAERIVNEQNLRSVVAEKYALNSRFSREGIAVTGSGQARCRGARNEVKKGIPKGTPRNGERKNYLDALLNSALVVTGMALVGMIVYNFL